MGSIGFPIKLLHEAEGHIVTGELSLMSSLKDTFICLRS
jgi:uncharacterized protein YjfI (DUF2170 family)